MQTKVIHVDPKTLKLLEMNARFMRHEEFQRLVANVKKDGQLTSAPFAARNADGTYEVLSGNHRVQAAIAAGVESIPCIITDDELSKEQRIAIQLSGLDDKTLGLLDKASSQAMTEANLEYQVLSIVYLPDELKDAQRIIGKALETTKNSAAVWLARDSEYDRWLDAQETASSAHNVKNVSAAIKIILDIFERNLTQLSEGWDGEDSKHDNSTWVPLSTVLGRSKIPAGGAKTIKRALDKMVGSGEITSKNLYDGLVKLCADYIEKK